MLLGQKRRDTTVTTRPATPAKRPANVIAAVVGIGTIALGVWALIKTGINTDHIFTPTKDVLGLPHTPTLALGENRVRDPAARRGRARQVRHLLDRAGGCGVVRVRRDRVERLVVGTGAPLDSR